MNLTAILRINVGQKPVGQHVRLDSPSQRKLALRCLNVDKARFRLRHRSARLLNGKGVCGFLWLGRSRGARHREVQNADRGLESSKRLNVVTLAL
jgi:hypothetical protein